MEPIQTGKSCTVNEKVYLIFSLSALKRKIIECSDQKVDDAC